ncbi:MAG: ribosomal-processing cysteine protease Prp [Clostridia bacterium]|nr:ribosomal-processing cysteine protease Prp [Clostridia bacterium]
MTRIVLTAEPDSLDLSVIGHAGSCPGGPDTVCAAASMLVCALMERLERLRQELCELHIDYSSGRCEISASASGSGCLRLHDAVEVAMCGFDLLAAAFPKSVRVERGGGLYAQA